MKTMFELNAFHGRGFQRILSTGQKHVLTLQEVHGTYVFLFKFLGQSFELFIVSIFVVPRSFLCSFTGLRERERKKFRSAVPGNQNHWHISAEL